MSINTEEEYCLATQFSQAQNAVKAMGDECTRNLCTKEELAHIATRAMSFDNVHLVAYELSMTQSRVARDLYEELAYYVEKNMI